MALPGYDPRRSTRVLRVLLAVALCCARGVAESSVDFNRDVRPIFVRHCLACHGGVKQAGGLSLVWSETALGESDSGASIAPGDADGSYLIDRVVEADDEFRMPPAEHGRRLSEDEVATLRRWIDEGASWTLPWAMIPPRAVDPPAVGSGWARGPIDRFVYRRLAAEGLAPSPEASRLAWLRRVSFDLVGLPPSESERDAFLADERPGAYGRVVERLLASPHFGERWATLWLDLVRYADTKGYEKDVHRDIWPYRDWVIRAFDADTPYDRFLVEQLAGDLLPDPTMATRLATAMHRNTPTNVEGGTDDEEFRVAAVVDRVDTTWQAIGGLTFGCARCHDHPYDPITHRDYYRYLACFNSTQDADLAEDFPHLSVPLDPARWAEAEALDTEILTARGELFDLGVELADSAEWRGVAFDSAESTGATEMRLHPVAESIGGSAGDGVEARAGGTITDRSVYTLAAPAPAGRVTALRLDALPTDLEAALAQPEMGFVLARLRMYVERRGARHEVFFHAVLTDDAAPFFDPEDSIADNASGWSAYSRLLRPRWAVFVVDAGLDGPVELVEGDRLTIVLKHDKALDGQDAIVLRRLRVSLTDDARFARLIDDRAFLGLRGRLADLVERRDALPSQSTPVLSERPDGHDRPTHRFERGNRLVKAERVDAGTPDVLPAAPSSGEPARLQMARWTASADNPLTARVWVNRVWSELFGQGLVATLDDFGSTGAAPTHPHLLDHLAQRFVEEWGWRLKPLLAEIVLSATYRQDARVDENLVRRDPKNRLLARGPRTRLRAEMIRDQALRLSGRFNDARFGPPVMPYQPEGVWRSVYNGQDWTNAKNNDRFRRAIYTYWKRTAAYPSLVAFDAPSRDRCVAQRATTNTPLQALVAMNDPAFVELAEAFAERMLALDADTPGRIAWGYAMATGATPSAKSLAALAALHRSTRAGGELASEKSAMAVVAGALLNLDATLSK